jgi:hypothetical protein
MKASSEGCGDGVTRNLRLVGSSMEEAPCFECSQVFCVACFESHEWLIRLLSDILAGGGMQLTLRS